MPNNQRKQVKEENLPRIINTIKELYELKDFDGVRRATAQLLEQFPNHMNLMSLHAFSLGNLGRHAEAREVFMEIYALGGDDVFLGNSIQAAIASGDVDYGIEATREIFWELNEDARRIILWALVTAVSEGCVTEAEVIHRLGWWPKDLTLT
jgi:hypothetical protein